MSKRQFGRTTRLLLSALLLCPSTALAEQVRFLVQPEFGSTRIISRHQFRVCMLRSVDPWSTLCLGWRPVQHGQVLSLLGAYCVFARWGDDLVYRGSVLIPPGSPPMVVRVSPQPRANSGGCV
jgi:hypothetical protein